MKYIIYYDKSGGASLSSGEASLSSGVASLSSGVRPKFECSTYDPTTLEYKKCLIKYFRGKDNLRVVIGADNMDTRFIGNYDLVINWQGHGNNNYALASPASAYINFNDFAQYGFLRLFRYSLVVFDMSVIKFLRNISFLVLMIKQLNIGGKFFLPLLPRGLFRRVILEDNFIIDQSSRERVNFFPFVRLGIDIILNHENDTYTFSPELVQRAKANGVNLLFDGMVLDYQGILFRPYFLKLMKDEIDSIVNDTSDQTFIFIDELYPFTHPVHRQEPYIVIERVR